VIGRSRCLILDTSRGRVVLKEYKRTVALAAVLHEHSILQQLAIAGFPAPRVVALPSGETYLQDGDRIYALFAYIEGCIHYHNYLMLPYQARQFISAAGETLAAVHECLYGFVPEGRNLDGFRSATGSRWRDRAWCERKLERCIVRQRQFPSLDDKASPAGAMLLECAEWIARKLEDLDHRLETAELPRRIIHADYGPYNLAFGPNRSPIVMDFEIARLDWRIADLAKAIPNFSVNRLGFDWHRMAWFLSGYQAGSYLSLGELCLIPSAYQFLLLRRMLVCWDELLVANRLQWERGIQHCLEHIRWVDANEWQLQKGLEKLYRHEQTPSTRLLGA
jgi:Ser/Thr protein kinase RdoA (MazF antagonist)